MIAKVAHIVIILVALALAGCSPSADSGRLQRAAALVESDPSAALAICDSIADPESLPDADRALYGCVSSLAQTILHQPVGKPLMLDFAINYYSDYYRADRLRLVQCVFAKSANLIESQQFADAANLTSDALLELGTSGHDGWRGRLYRQMADISVYFLDVGNVLQYTDSAIRAFERAGLSAQSQYEQLSYASYLSGAGFPEDALAYLDSIFLGNTEFYYDNRDEYFAVRADICTNLNLGNEALDCLAQIANPDFTTPPYNRLQTYIIATAQVGNFSVCDSLVSVLQRVCVEEEPLEHTLNYRYVLYTVDKCKGNDSQALNQLETWVSISDSIHTVSSQANVEWYESRLAIEQIELRGRDRLSAAWFIITVLVIVFLTTLMVLMRLNGKRKIQNLKYEADLARLEATVLQLEREANDSGLVADNSLSLAMNEILRELTYKSGSINSEKIAKKVRDIFNNKVYCNIAQRLESRYEGLNKLMMDVGLNETDRMILILSKCGLSSASIAIISEMKEHNVSVRKSRVKDKLEKMHDERGKRVFDFFWAERN